MQCAFKTSFFNCALLLQVYIKDTDERACAYIAGPAPNRWGFATGNDLFNVIQRSGADGNFNLICARSVPCLLVYKLDLVFASVQGTSYSC